MKVRTTAVIAVVGGLLAAVPGATAAITPYVANVSGNLSDWTAAATASGDTINTDLDFESASLVNNFVVSNSSGSSSGSIADYQASHGATMSVSFVPTGTGTRFGSASVVNGTGPDNANSSGSNPGEGQHAASNYLYVQMGSSIPQGGNAITTFGLSFDSPVSGVGMKLIDVYDPYTGLFSSVPTLNAYDGPDGTGTLLGSYTLPGPYNFQTSQSSNQRWIYMGLLSTQADIQSITLSRSLYNSYYNRWDAFGIDDIEYTTQQVPDPASATLGLLGLFFGTSVFRRRRA